MFAVTKRLEKPHFLLFACLLASACDDGDPEPGADAQMAMDAGDAGADGAMDAAAEADSQAPMPDATIDAGSIDAALDASNEAPSDASSDASATADAALPACSVMAPTSCPDPAPRYADVEPIFTARCTICHGKMIDGPWPLDSYGHVADWADDIRAELVACTMPPPDAAVPMTNDERRAILDWLRCGLPK